MIKYPLFFEVSAKSTRGVNTPFEAKAEEFPTISGTIPKQFGGPGSGYSPEDLLALAVISCLIATFKVFAEKTQFSYSDISATCKLTIDRNAQGIPEIKKLEMHFVLTGVQDEEKAKSLLAEAQKYCLVANATTCEKSYSYEFSTQS